MVKKKWRRAILALLGQYNETDLLQKKFLADLPVARKRLREFKTLDTLFDSFAGYENKQYDKTGNLFLHWCLPFNPNEVRLKEVEDALVFFGALRWNLKRRKALKKKLCSDDYFDGLTKYTEFTYATWLVDKLGVGNVMLEPELTTGKVSDILANVNTRIIYIELGNLSESTPEKKIQRILNAAAAHLRTKVNGTPMVYMEVNIPELLVLDNQDHIDEVVSTSRICCEIDRLCIDKLKGFEGMIDLSDISLTLSLQPTLEKLGPLVLPQDAKKLEQIKQPPLDGWVQCCRGELEKGSKLINWFSIHKAPFLLVEIHPMLAFPSKAAKDETDAFLRHVTRHINGQLEQLQPGSPNIIVVQGFNWVLFGLGEDFEDVEPLVASIRAYLHDKKLTHLSGVGFFSNDYSKSIFVPNMFAAKESELSSAEVKRLGMRIV